MRQPWQIPSLTSATPLPLRAQRVVAGEHVARHEHGEFVAPGERAVALDLELGDANLGLSVLLSEVFLESGELRLMGLERGLHLRDGSSESSRSASRSF